MEISSFEAARIHADQAAVADQVATRANQTSVARRARMEQRMIDGERRHTEAAMASERSPRAVPFDADHRAPAQPERDTQARSKSGHVIDRNPALLTQAAQMRENALAMRAASVLARARFNAADYALRLKARARVLTSTAQHLCATALTLRHEGQLTRERAERDLRRRTKHGLVLTPTMLLDLADEIAQLGFTDLSWYFRAAASGFLPPTAAEGSRMLPRA